MLTSDSQAVPPARGRRRALLALLLLVPAPAIGTAAAMMLPATAGTPLGRGIYVLSKVWLLALPAVWLLLVDRGRPGLSPARRGGFAPAAIVGLAISGVIYGAYLLVGTSWIDPEMVITQARESGIDTPLKYLLFTLGIVAVNAVLEEYVWRWFVFRKCEVLLPSARGALAVLLSAALFTVHHVIALRAQFPWTATLLASSGVFAGGAVWSWFYLRYRSIWPGYVSHAIVDVTIFAIGWRIIFG